jgi:hypothetical protein
LILFIIRNLFNKVKNKKTQQQKLEFFQKINYNWIFSFFYNPILPKPNFISSKYNPYKAFKNYLSIIPNDLDPKKSDYAKAKKKSQIES